MRKLSSRIGMFLEWILVGLLAILVLLATAETLAWTFFTLSFPAAAEIQGLLLIWFALLAAAYGVEQGLHLSVELVSRRLPRRARAGLERAALLLVAVFGLLLVVYGFRLVASVGNTLPVTGLPAAFEYAPVVVGGGLLAFFALVGALAPPHLAAGDGPHDG